MDIIKFFESRAFVYGIIFLCFIIPTLYPIGLPITITQGTKDFFDYVEKLPEESYIVIVADMQIGVRPELGPTQTALFKYGLKRGFKIIFIEFGYNLGGSVNTAEMIREVEAKGFLDDYEYGVDYVHLGWQPGWETGVAQVASDFKKNIMHVDHYGNLVAGMKILEPINTAADTDLWFVLTGYGSGGLEVYLRQVQVPYGTKIALAPLAYYTTMFMPFYKSGQIVGIMPSLGAGGELEHLTGFPGKGLAATDITSATHVVFIVLLLIGNIGYLYKKSLSGKKIIGG